MKNFILHKLPKQRQYLISLVVVFFVALLGYFLSNWMGYRMEAFLLLVTISILAMFLDITPVLLAAILSALIWDFFFIPPRFTFTVGTTEDQLLLLMYFLVAMINGVLTYKIRQMEKEVRAKEKKAQTVKLYNTLFNSLSHELRTPITAIIGATDALQTTENRLTDNDKSELLQEISIASLRLNQQVENLLNMSRLETGVFQIKKDWVDIKELVYTTLKRMESTLQKHTVSVYISDTLPLFKIDFGLMEQVLHNLLVNACLYTPEGSVITIQANTEEDALVMTVADNGHGFPESDLKKVFAKFYRGHGVKAGGTGLGLSIVKGFVEAHQGTIALKNLPLSGALFTIKIPTETSYLNGLKNE